jgi:hypothetical protein
MDTNERLSGLDHSIDVRGRTPQKPGNPQKITEDTERGTKQKRQKNLTQRRKGAKLRNRKTGRHRRSRTKRLLQLNLILESSVLESFVIFCWFHLFAPLRLCVRFCFSDFCSGGYFHNNVRNLCNPPPQSLRRDRFCG